MPTGPVRNANAAPIPSTAPVIMLAMPLKPPNNSNNGPITLITN